MQENFVLVPWEDAINFVADAVEKTVKENGKHSVAYYGSGQLGTEETHIMNKTLKGGGMLANNAVEGQPRMCMASAVVGYLYTFGKDEPYGSLDDIDVPDPDFGKHADTFFLIGNNTAEAHPILFNRMAALKAKIRTRSRSFSLTREKPVLEPLLTYGCPLRQAGTLCC